VTTNSPELAEQLRRFRNHGIVPKPEEGGWYYEISSLGFNYRITDLQCALGAAQLGKLTRFVERRNSLADRYRELLAELPLELPPAAPAGWSHAYHLFPVRVDDRRAVYDRLRAAGIGTQVHYVPIYRHPLYADLGLDPSSFPNTEAAYARLLSLPLYPDLSHDEQDVVVDAIREVL
jgi:dTDP-4-amino-4,6-dideoxygalactose transaminase